ncbi:hypothetical protein BGZ57DRAFT_979976 [Hyaloscypha finlandica]|nr:hypothetical protein BGZ57DRAFT_979976 [Hyaloscypha finlandica]
MEKIAVQITNYIIITNYVIFRLLGRALPPSFFPFFFPISYLIILTSRELVASLKNLTIYAYKTYLNKAKGKSITLSKYKGRPISNLEKHKLTTYNESLTSYYYSPKINNNDSRDELLTSRNSYTFYNKLETSLELYNPAYLFLTNEEKEAIPGLLNKVKITIILITGYNKKDSNSLDNLIILNND